MRCQESKGSFQVVFYFLSFFKWPEMFKAGLLLLEVVYVQICLAFALLSFAGCKEANDLGPLHPCT